LMYKPIDADVIIVGSGVAGLSAAFCLHLKEPTLHFIILEGNANIGGRAFSVPLAVGNDGESTSYFDVGGQWICSEQNLLLDLLDTLGIPLTAQQKQGKVIVEHRNMYAVHSVQDLFNFLGPYDKLQFTIFIDKVEALCSNIKESEDIRHMDALNKLTLKEFIDNSIKSEAVRAVIEYIVLLNCGVRTSQISALFYIFFCISTKGIANQMPTEKTNLHELRIKGGVKYFCDRIVEEIGMQSIFTEEYVTGIHTNDGYVEIKTKGNTYYSYNVIVAVSPGDVLKIKFRPPLPRNKIDAISNTSTNAVTNFVVTYPRDFWTEEGFCGDIYIFDKDYTNGPIDFCMNIDNNDQRPAITGRIFNSGPVKGNHRTYSNDVLEQLFRYFGEEALYPVDYYEKSFSLGLSQMTCWYLGNIDYINSISSANGRIFWAGAETSSEWYGCLAGAVYSGNRAALEVLYDLRPQLLTTDDMMILSPTRRSLRARLRECPKENVYYVVVHWKYYLSVSLLVLIVLWRLRTRYLKWNQQ
ncbi:hypothetical protein NQ317_008682, partial [Molorchus minor]